MPGFISQHDCAEHPWLASGAHASVVSAAADNWTPHGEIHMKVDVPRDYRPDTKLLLFVAYPIDIILPKELWSNVQ